MDTETVINNAQTPDTFDVLAFIESTAYPTETITVYQDVKSADEYVKLVNERIEFDKDAKNHQLEITSLTERINELATKITASKITFSLRGLPPGIVDDIMEVPAGEEDNEAADQRRSDTLLAQSIIGVSNAKGVIDNQPWDADKVAKLRAFLKQGEFGKLIKGVTEVNFNALVFDAATDAGFSGGSADVA